MFDLTVEEARAVLRVLHGNLTDDVKRVALYVLPTYIHDREALEQAQAAAPELWEAKTQAEDTVQDTISGFYDGIFRAEDIGSLKMLGEDIEGAVQARDTYFDAVDM